MSDKSGESFQDSLNDWLVSIIVAVALAFCIRTFIFEPYKVEGTSMYPTLFHQERLIVNKIIYFLSIPTFPHLATPQNLFSMLLSLALSSASSASISASHSLISS